MAGNGNIPEKGVVRVYLTSPKLVAYTSFSNPQEVGRRISMVRNWLKEHQVRETGAPSCIFAPSLEVQCEISSFTTIDPFPGPGEVGIKWVQPERVASIFHQGDTDTIEESLAFLKKAIQENGCTICGPHREIYLFEVCQPKSRWVTEIQLPVFEEGSRKPQGTNRSAWQAMKVGSNHFS